MRKSATDLIRANQQIEAVQSEREKIEDELYRLKAVQDKLNDLRSYELERFVQDNQAVKRDDILYDLYAISQSLEKLIAHLKHQLSKVG